MKLFELLTTLSKPELKSFGKYIKAIIKDEKAYILYQDVRKLYPEFTPPRRFKENLYQKIYGYGEYNSRKINYLISDVTQALEDYFIILQARRNPMSRRFLLMEYYKESQNAKYFHKMADEVLNDVNNDDIKGGKHYLDKMRIHYDLYFDVPSDKNRITKQVDLANNMTESLDEFYIYYKLKVETDLMSFSTYNLEQQSNFMLNDLLKNLPKHPFHKNELIDIYHFYLKSYKANDETFYLEIKNKVLAIIDKLPKIHQKDLFSILSNYLISAKRYNMSNSIYYNFEIHQLGIDNGYSINDGKLSFQYFSNAIFCAIATNELEWAKKTIQEKAHLLEDDLREDVLKLARANVAYIEERYLDALFELNDLDQIRHYSIAFQSRFILLKTYFELAIKGGPLSDEIYDFMATYKNYIKRSQILGDTQKTSVIQTIKYTKRILESYYTKKESWKNIENDINTSKTPIGASSWLTAKIEILKHKGRH
jgi:hypothetical protein